MNALELADLRKTYENGHVAVDGLSLTVPTGCVYGFLGVNGAGKTTTIRIMAGLAQQDSGTVSFFGKPVVVGVNDHKRRVGFVLDEPTYFNWMPVRKYLEFIGGMYQLPAATINRRVQDLLTFFDLRTWADQAIETFSTGMRKKVSLAAAIIHDPELIVLDEPLDGIDALAARTIKQTLTGMAQSGKTVFITSHALDTIERMCDRLTIIHEGKVMLEGKTTQLLRNFRSRHRADASLEDLFVHTVGVDARAPELSWLTDAPLA